MYDREGWQLHNPSHHPPCSSYWPLPPVQGHEDRVDGVGLDTGGLGGGSQVQQQESVCDRASCRVTFTSILPLFGVWLINLLSGFCSIYHPLHSEGS